ncbi:MAG: GMC family oxidoreductase [Polyangiaceae bacterium]|nr:GMC family oxidoreductase [Polyangiaceae bacterium]
MSGAPARRAQVLVIGSGAGGATAALTLAERGHDVLVLEEGPRIPDSRYGGDAVDAMDTWYRDRGMTPILGRVPIGFVEGRCVGGSTEINSGFWHRTPRETLLRWRTRFGLDVTPEELEPCFAWAEALLHVSLHAGPRPASTELFARGIERMGWSAQEVPRAARGCQGSNACAQGCPTGAKQGVTRRLLPAAVAAGARVVADCRAKLLTRRGPRVTGVFAELGLGDGRRELVHFEADHVVVAGGPLQTPFLLRRSGFRYNVGATLGLHPMLKVVARFPAPVDAEAGVLPLLGVREFWPDVSLGGAFTTRGHLAMQLSDAWPAARGLLAERRHLASYYVAVRGSGAGAVRPAAFGEAPRVTYDLSTDDLRHLSQGLGRLASALLAAGATEVWPTVQRLGPIRAEADAVRWLDELLDRRRLSLTTVHAFSSCPMGELHERTATDSRGRLRGTENVTLLDASVLPDSPGVNPQGSVMGLARHNALRLADELAR